MPSGGRLYIYCNSISPRMLNAQRETKHGFKSLSRQTILRRFYALLCGFDQISYTKSILYMHTLYCLLYCYTKTTSTNQTTQSSAFQPTHSQITLLRNILRNSILSNRTVAFTLSVKIAIFFKVLPFSFIPLSISLIKAGHQSHPQFFRCKILSRSRFRETFLFTKDIKCYQMTYDFLCIILKI